MTLSISTIIMKRRVPTLTDVATLPKAETEGCCIASPIISENSRVNQWVFASSQKKLGTYLLSFFNHFQNLVLKYRTQFSISNPTISKLPQPLTYFFLLYICIGAPVLTIYSPPCVIHLHIGRLILHVYFHIIRLIFPCVGS